MPSALARLVLFQDAAQNPGLLAYGFERSGIGVSPASTVRQVLHLVDSGHGQLVVSSVNGQSGRELVGEMGRRKSPLLVLGSRPSQSGPRIGWLPKPLYLRDVVTMARLLYSANDNGVWAGEIQNLELFFLLRALKMSGRQGVLSLTRGERRGGFQLSTDEDFAWLGVLRGKVAAEKLFVWSGARYEFVPTVQTSTCKTVGFLEEASSFLASFQLACQGLSAHTVCEQDLPQVARTAPQLPRAVAAVLRLCDGSRDLIDVTTDSPFGPIETAKTVSRLIEMGLVRTHARPASVSPPRPAFDEVEEEFFRQEDRFATAVAPKAESFDDLDEGHLPPEGFWRRLFGSRAPVAAKRVSRRR